MLVTLCFNCCSLPWDLRVKGWAIKLNGIHIHNMQTKTFLPKPSLSVDKNDCQLKSQHHKITCLHSESAVTITSPLPFAKFHLCFEFDQGCVCGLAWKYKGSEQPSHLSSAI